jgi:ATP-binding cassette subfamily B protein RaxB
MDLQSTANECGICCMKVILSEFGKEVDKESIYKRLKKIGGGLSLSVISNLATSFGLICRAVRISDLSDLKQISTPCILHWNMNHYVVLLKINNRKLIVYDPASGNREISYKEAESSMTGVVVEFERGNEFDTAIEYVEKKQFPLNLSRYKGSIGFLLFLTVLSQVAALGTPVYTQLIIDEAIVEGDESALVALILGLIAIMIGELCVRSLRMVLSVGLTMKLARAFGSRFIDRLIRLDLSYFESREIGDTLSRYGSLQAIRGLITNEYVHIGIDLIVVLVSSIAMVYYSVFLFLVAVSISLVYIIIRSYFLPKVRTATNILMQSIGSFETKFIEIVESQKAVKCLSAEDKAANTLINKMVDNLNSEFSLATLSIKLSITEAIFISISTVLAIYFSGVMVIEQELTVGMFFAYLAYLSKYNLSLSGFVGNFFSIKAAKVHFDRIAQIQNAKVDNNYLVVDGAQDAKMGAWELNDVAFSYGDKYSVFSNINFRTEDFSVLMIAGPSGCGKSTLLHCMAGLYPLDGGEILFNGRSVYGDSAFRRNASVVFQDDKLISGTVVQNITFFDVNIDMELVRRCARLACIEEEINNMSMGYHTPIYGYGHNISGGQIQRLLLARALYKAPKILFLDESLNQVSPSLEQEIVSNLVDENVKVIGVAHRKESLALADTMLGFPGWENG